MVAKTIAIIPARGNSQRIPHKNIIDFLGKPMIAWTIEAALASHCFDRVVVSTDDDQTADIARFYGAEVPFLRTDKADEYSPVSEATLLALKQAENYWNETYTMVVQLMANCPLRTAQDITLALSYFDAHQQHFQISCFKYGWMNPWWACKLDENNYPVRLFPDSEKQRSQDLPPLYCPTGAIWVADAMALQVQGTFYGKGHVFQPISWQSAIDIDDDDDLAFAQAIALVQQKNKHHDKNKVMRRTQHHESRSEGRCQSYYRFRTYHALFNLSESLI